MLLNIIQQQVSSRLPSLATIACVSFPVVFLVIRYEQDLYLHHDTDLRVVYSMLGPYLGLPII